MALFSINYGSDVMNKYMGMTVILPESDDGVKDEDGNYAVIYLLHGYTDDHTKWSRLTSIERYANAFGIAVVMPDGGKSFYTDMVHGDPYFTYLTEEVPSHVNKWFSITNKPAFTSIAGLSMGGYGAMKIALTYPERYKAAATFSGSLAMQEMVQTKMPEVAEPWLKRLEMDLPLVYGYDTEIAGTQHDVFWLASQLKAKDQQAPDLYISCGTEDFIYPASDFFHQHLLSLGIPHTFHPTPGVHEWGLWDMEVKRFLEMLVAKV